VTAFPALEEGPTVPPPTPALTAPRSPLFGVTFSEHAHACVEIATLAADGLEVLFKGAYDFASRTITSVDVMALGHATRVPALTSYFRPGDFHVHSHPNEHCRPSDADLSCAEDLYAMGVGFAVVNRGASQLHVVTLPRRAEPPAPRVRCVRLGGSLFTLTRHRL
jgi:hypothetical protein